MGVRRWQTRDVNAAKPSSQRPVMQQQPQARQMPDPQLDRTGSNANFMEPVNVGGQFQQMPSGTVDAGFVPSFMQQGSMAISNRPMQRPASSLYEQLQNALYTAKLPDKKVINVNGRQVVTGKDYDQQAGF